jgi:putative FmdB family regulatory protein
MPIYEYRCGACGQEHEVLQKVSEPPLTQCPACGKPALQKLLSAAGFQLKGSGWYATDFKGAGKKPEQKKADEKKTDEKKTDEKKTEAKPETKSDAKPASSTATTD